MKQTILRISLLIMLLSGLTINLHKGHLSLTTACLYACDPNDDDGGENDSNTGSNSSSSGSGSTHTIHYIYDSAGNRIVRQYVLLQSKAVEGDPANDDNKEDRQLKIYQNPTIDNLLTEYIKGKVNDMNFLYL
jgi:hypothetical protein